MRMLVFGRLLKVNQYPRTGGWTNALNVLTVAANHVKYE